MKKQTAGMTATIVLITMLFGVCNPAGEEPEEVSLPVVSNPLASISCENIEGWTVSLTGFRIAVEDFEFSIEGETHAGLDVVGILAPSAHAHPGHLAGGTITGELSGQYVLDFLGDGRGLGNAVLLAGDYKGMNFYFRTAGTDARHCGPSRDQRGVRGSSGGPR